MCFESSTGVKKMKGARFKWMLFVVLCLSKLLTFINLKTALDIMT